VVFLIEKGVIRAYVNNQQATRHANYGRRLL